MGRRAKIKLGDPAPMQNPAAEVESLRKTGKRKAEDEGSKRFTKKIKAPSNTESNDTRNDKGGAEKQGNGKEQVREGSLGWEDMDDEAHAACPCDDTEDVGRDGGVPPSVLGMAPSSEGASGYNPARHGETPPSFNPPGLPVANAGVGPSGLHADRPSHGPSASPASPSDPFSSRGPPFPMIAVSSSSESSGSERCFAAISESSMDQLSEAASSGGGKKARITGPMALYKVGEEIGRFNSIKLKDQERRIEMLAAFNEYMGHSPTKVMVPNPKCEEAMALLKEMESNLKPHHYVMLASLFTRHPTASQSYLLLKGMPNALHLWVLQKLKPFGDLPDPDEADIGVLALLDDY